MKSVYALIPASFLAFSAQSYGAPPEATPPKAAASVAVKLEKVEQMKEEKAIVKAEKKSANAVVPGGKGPVSQPHP